MIKCRSPRSLVFGMRNLWSLLVRSEYVASGAAGCEPNSTATRHSYTSDSAPVLQCR